MTEAQFIGLGVLACIFNGIFWASLYESHMKQMEWEDRLHEQWLSEGWK